MILEETLTLSNGVQIPKLGLGTWMIDDGKAAAAVRATTEIGYRHIDTAQAYGNERGVGEGVRASGIARDKLFVTTKLDVDKAQQGVQQILTDEANGYGAKNVKDVKCNNGQNPTVKKGDTFTCEVSIDGTKRQVTVTFQDDKGTYEVGRPK